MSVRSPEIPDIRQELPPRLRAKAESALQGNEILLAWFEPDLDRQLRFSQGLILLTDKRLISLADDESREQGARSREHGAGSTERGSSSPLPAPRFPPAAANGPQTADKAWQLSPEITLQAKEKGGASALELVNGHGLLAQWRHTPAKNKAAHHFVDRWKLFRSGLPAEGETGESSDALCPSCGLPIKGEQGFCENCASLPGAKPGRSLLRLLTFARKRRLGRPRWALS